MKSVLKWEFRKNNTGGNRSLKYPSYSEYSVVYWLWKNMFSEYKGMMHHRRSFTLENIFYIVIKKDAFMYSSEDLWFLYGKLSEN